MSRSNRTARQRRSSPNLPGATSFGVTNSRRTRISEDAMSFEQILGGAIAVIVAGMPAMVALLKINQLHLAVNSRMDKFIEGMIDQNKEREVAALKETDSRVAAIEHSRDLLVAQNTQLIDHFAELAKRI